MIDGDYIDIIMNNSEMNTVGNIENAAEVHPEQQHINIIKEILEEGSISTGRNGITKSLFVRTMRFKVSLDKSSCDKDNVDTAKVALKIPVSTTAGTMLTGIIEEFKSFVIRGETDSKKLEEHNVNIWKPNTEGTAGIIGPAYGHNYRNYGGTYDPSGQTRDGIDQIEEVIKLVSTDPGSRRMIVLNYDPRENDKAVLFPCQMMFQFYMNSDGLSVHAYNRSSDICCAGLWNSAFATLLLGYICARTGNKPNEVVVTFGNVHIYENQMELAAEHVTRKPIGTWPTVFVSADGNIEVKKCNDRSGYYPRLKYPLNA